MTFKHIFLMSTAAILAACGDTARAPTTEAGTSEFTLDYEKFTLSNGLEVVLHRDTSDPIVALTTVVHAGSNREKTGRTGFAHFFEHMAFNDSENVPRGWNRKAIPDWGGSRNGGTWSDGTIYYEVVPKDAFDKILWIDSDRLGYMLNTVTTAALEREKQVVKNEKRQRVDNAPYGYTQEVIRKALYPEGHPYSWTVIGSLPDLQAATLEDLTEFYSQYYGAGNATLAIAGDIDLAETKKKVERWFGEIKKGPDVKPIAAMPVTLTESKFLYFEDNFAKLPEIRLTFPSVEGYHKDEKALDVLGEIIGGSKNAALYQVIVDGKKLAPSVSAYNISSEIAGEFVIRVRANAGVDLDDVKAAIDTAVTQFETDGVDATDLQRIKAEQETQLYGSVSTVLGKSNQLASDNEFAGDPAYAIKSAAALTAVTAADVMAAYNKYVKGKPAIITSFVPKGQTALAVEGSEMATVWIEEVKTDVASEEVSAGEEAVYEKTPSKYDRSEPAFGDLPLVKMPDVWVANLPNSVRLLGIENSETPLVTFDIAIDGGRYLEALDKNGATNLLARLMNEGTATKTAAELEQAIGLLGSGISVEANADDVTIRATSLARNFEKTVALMEEILTAPRFETADFDRVKSAALTSIKGREANPNAIASLVFNRQLYGDEHPLGLPGGGSTASVSALTMDDLRMRYSGLKSDPIRIHIAGDVDQARAAKAFESVAGHFVRAKKVKRRLFFIPPPNYIGKVNFIDVPASKQSVIYIGKLMPETTHPDFNKISFTNEKFGGGISGDLAQVLRIEKGYTYGAYSGMAQGKTSVGWRIGTSVRANATEPSLTVIKGMINNYGPEFDDAAAELTRNKLLKENTRAFESLGAKLGTLRQISKYGKSKTYFEDEQKQLINMNTQDFKDIAAKYMQQKDMVYVIVGDKETQLAPVQEFAGGDVIELDIYGNVVE